MSETRQAFKPSANHPSIKPKVERETQHPSALTATIELSKDERLLNEKSFLWLGSNV